MLKKKLFYLVVFTLLSFAVNAQAKKITGTVTTADNLPLQGVLVKLKGGKALTLTSATGQFSVDISENLNTKTLVFSFIGYTTSEVVITNQETLTVKLIPSISDLDEVVVIGYGTQRKRDLTGAVAKVDISDLQKAPVRSFEEALGGRVAGVSVTSSDGQPGSANNIVIRGNNSITQDNSPLWVVDGVPIENPNNNAINPADIESIEVLKDASATAIYGARAANGVIMVTTKKGVLGKTKFSFASSYAEQDIIKTMKVLSPYEFVRYQSELDPINTNSQYLTNGNTVDYYKAILGVNWQNAVLKTAPMLNHSLSMSGGTDATKYYVSLSALNQEGVIKFSGYDRYQGRFRLDQTVNAKLKLSLNVNYSALKSYGTIPSSLENGSSQSSSLMSQVWGYRPVTNNQNYDIDAEDPLFAGDPNDSRFNPYERIRYEVRNRFSNTIFTNLAVDYKITKDLSFKSTLGVTNDVNRNETFNGSKTPAGSPTTVSGRANGVNGSVIYQTTNSYVNENTFNYNKKFGKKNTIDAVAGFTTQGVSKYNYGVAAAKLPNES